MVDHPVEDIIERVGCQFYTKVRAPVFFLRRLKTDSYANSTSEVDRRTESGILAGRFVSWDYLSEAQYDANSGYISDVCVSRYNEKEHLTVRIKNWGSCIPDVSNF